ncbi:MAG: SulP family inorganic anion transporter, partial [Flavobacteriales bacterium]
MSYIIAANNCGMDKNNKNTWTKDLYSGVVVFLVAIPLCLGIALASGAPLFSGLIAGLIGGIVIGSISDSQLGVSGPAAGLAVIVLNAIESFGTFEIFLCAVVVAGIVQILMGILRAGMIGDFFPTSVIKGMLAGIGVIIIIKEIPYALGFTGESLTEVLNQAEQDSFLAKLPYLFNYISLGAIIVCGMSLIIMYVWDMILSKKSEFINAIPGPLAAVIAGIFYDFFIGTSGTFGIPEGQLVNVPEAESLGDFISFFTFPDLSNFFRQDVWMSGIVMAIIASLETLLSVEAVDKLDPHKRTTNKNRELLAQGTGNMFSGFIGGLPTTQVIIRSSTNVMSGGQTKKATIIHGFLILLCVMLLPRTLNMIPLAVLAAILFKVGYNLAKPQLFKQMYNNGWDQLIPFVVTIVGVVATNLLQGIMIGLAVAIFYILRNNYRNTHF